MMSDVSKKTAQFKGHNKNADSVVDIEVIPGSPTSLKNSLQRMEVCKFKNQIDRN